jgi:uncharacterized protein
MMKNFIPSRQTCLALIEQHDMLPNIKAHSLQVARIAICLGKNLLAHFPRLNMDLVEAGALLHDIAKTECLKTRGNHAALGEAMVRNMGYDSVAPIVGQHVLLEKEYFDNGSMDEVILVHYADKRVVHEEVVGLEERFEYLIKTYGRSNDAIQLLEALYQDTLILEKRIFQHLSFPPQDLKDHLELS